MHIHFVDNRFECSKYPTDVSKKLELCKTWPFFPSNREGRLFWSDWRLPARKASRSERRVLSFLQRISGGNRGPRFIGATRRGARFIRLWLPHG